MLNEAHRKPEEEVAQSAIGEEKSLTRPRPASNESTKPTKPLGVHSLQYSAACAAPTKSSLNRWPTLLLDFRCLFCPDLMAVFLKRRALTLFC